MAPANRVEGQIAIVLSVSPRHVTLCLRRLLADREVCSSAFRVTELAILIEILCVLPQSLQKNAGIVPSSSNDPFPSNLPFICHLTIPFHTLGLVTAS